MMSRYYMADGTVQRGPFAIADLPGSGLRGETLVWKEGMDQWRRADQVEELIFAGILAPPPPGLPAAGSVPYAQPYGYAPPPPPPAYSAVNSQRLTAGILGIVLGSLGIHKFVLGMPVPGLIMLLLTILTCGWASIVTGVIGLIEGIIYLTKSDEQFYYEYMANKKQWF